MFLIEEQLIYTSSKWKEQQNSLNEIIKFTRMIVR